MAPAFLGDTWAWDGTNWVQLAPATSPSPRARGWLEWDILHSRALYFGGKNTTANLALAETWLWDSTTWTQVVTANAPAWNSGNGLIAYGMTHDPLRDRFVLVGGTRTTASVSPQTYEFTGTDWVLHNTGGLVGRTAPAVAFVPATGVTYTFGGYNGAAFVNDTFEYQTDDWPGYVPFGAGCAGSAGVPTLAGGTTWLGETHHTAIGGLDPSALCFGLIGLSSTSWSGGALPVPLQAVYPQTAANCLLLVSPDVSAFLVNSNGTADLAIGLPVDPGFLGVNLFVQVAQLDAAFQLSVSAGAGLVLGAK